MYKKAKAGYQYAHLNHKIQYMDRWLKDYQLLPYHDGLLQRELEEGNPPGQLESEK